MRRRRPEPLGWRAAGAIVLLFGAPAVVIPGALDRFVFGKFAVAALGAALGLVARQGGRLESRLAAVLLAGAALLVVDAALSTSPAVAFAGRSPRFAGVMGLGIYAAVLAATARLFGPEPDERLTRLAMRVLAFTTVLVAIVAVVETLGLRPLASNVARPGSLLGNAGDEGAFGVLALGPLAAVAVHRRDRWLAAAAAAAAITVGLSESRAALVALVAEVLVLGVVFSDRRIRGGLGAALVVVGIIVFVVPTARARVLDRSPLAAHTVHGRQLLWDETAALVLHHPLTGVGPSGFENAIVVEHDLRWQRDVGSQEPPDDAHNWVLQTAAVGGLPLAALTLGLVSAVVGCGVAAVRCGRARGDLPIAAGALAAVVGYGVATLFQPISPGPMILALALTGILVAQPVPGDHPRCRIPESAWRPIVVGVVTALAIVSTLAAAAEISLRRAILAAAAGDLAAADHYFTVAHHLRPWDADFDAEAAHAFATLAAAGVPEAADRALPWVRRAGSVLNDDVGVIEDRAAVAAATGRLDTAARLLRGLLRTDRRDPVVLIRLGVIDIQRRDYAIAERDLRDAMTVAANDPQLWRAFALLYRSAGQPGRAAAAQEKARNLSEQ